MKNLTIILAELIVHFFLISCKIRTVRLELEYRQESANLNATGYSNMVYIVLS